LNVLRLALCAPIVHKQADVYSAACRESAYFDSPWSVKMKADDEPPRGEYSVWSDEA